MFTAIGLFGPVTDGFMFVGLKPKAERGPSGPVLQRLRRTTASVVGVVAYYREIQNINLGGRISKGEFQYTMQSSETETLYKSSDDMLERIKAIPGLRDVSILRTWTGLCDVTPDYSPIIDRTPVENLIVSAGWGTYGFKAAPIVGVTLAKLIASGAGHVVNITSLAAHANYEGGAGYNAAKHAAYAVNEVMRLELVAEPVRVTEIAPGLVKTDEFSLVRFRGDTSKAEAPYEGVPEPLVADDIADCVAWAVTRPAHVNIDRIDVQPRVQAVQDCPTHCRSGC